MVMGIVGFKTKKELKGALGLPAATSFKHVSPAGAAVAVDLDVVARGWQHVCEPRRFEREAYASVHAGVVVGGIG